MPPAVAAVTQSMEAIPSVIVTPVEPAMCTGGLSGGVVEIVQVCVISERFAKPKPAVALGSGASATSSASFGPHATE
jgi:hypothetical protein